MLVHRRVTPSIKFAGTHLYTWGGERHCESKVSCPGTQHNVPGQGSNPDSRALTMRPPRLLGISRWKPSRLLDRGNSLVWWRDWRTLLGTLNLARPCKTWTKQSESEWQLNTAEVRRHFFHRLPRPKIYENRKPLISLIKPQNRRLNYSW